jgi:hypothetical protein
MRWFVGNDKPPFIEKLHLCGNFAYFQGKWHGREGLFRNLRSVRFMITISPQASDWQSEASELAVRLDGLNTKYAENLQNRFKISIFANRKRNKQ